MKTKSSLLAGIVLSVLAAVPAGAREVLVPKIQGPWWTIARDPDLGPLTSPTQQPVDFAIWQAGDGTWQLWSCIRNTREAGKTRLFHRWEGRRLTAPDWQPMGIAMRADLSAGETPGGLQAPHVVRHAGLFHMFYGDWEHICRATSSDGKRFARQLDKSGKAGLFGEGSGNNTRDPMVLRTRDRWHCYYTAYPNRLGSVFCRTSADLVNWSEARQVAFGGEAGTNAFSAECPFVVELSPGQFYLLRTQRYGRDAVSRVYYSTDPLDFGVNADERHLVCSLPVAAPEIIAHDGGYYIAALLPGLKGIAVARLEWVRNE